MRLRVIWVGKTRNPKIGALTMDYLERARHLIPCEIIEARDPSRGRSMKGDELREAEAVQLLKLLSKGAALGEGSNRIVVLDEKGRQFSSPEFARWFEAEENRGTRGVSFVIGGPEGVSSTVTERAHMVLSLGRMTWTHEFCRVMLLEQIYRAMGILKHIPYHK
jgi:23S rRNA (pseudouridine1915-N3)-methyltransferase